MRLLVPWLAAVLLLGVVFIASCRTNPHTGANEVERDACRELVKQLEIAQAGCMFVPDHDDSKDADRNRRLCHLSTRLGLAASALGCEFAPDHPDAR